MKITILLIAAAGALLTSIALWPPVSHSDKSAPFSRVREWPIVMHDVTPGPSDSGSFDRSRMLRQLSAVEDSAVRALKDRALAATSAQEKGACADALALSGSHEAVASLITLAALQEDPVHRAAILEGLNNLTAAEGLSSLASTLAATQDAEIVGAATAALARAGNAETLTALVDFYRERNSGPQQKNAVLHAIASLRSPEVQPALTKLAVTAVEPALAAAAQSSLETSP